MSSENLSGQRATNETGVHATTSLSSPRAHHSKNETLMPEVLARLEWLDDLIFEAIEGNPASLDNAATAWKETLDELGEATLEESRLQYMRHARSVWESLRDQPNHPPHKMFAAIEIISILAEEGDC